MELSVAITLMCGLSFLGILGVKLAKGYFETEQSKSKQSMEHQVEISKLTEMLKISDNSNRNYIYKIRKIRDHMELNYEDIEYDDDEKENDEFKLSELAQSIYPKLPPSLAKLIDKESFQEAILKTVEKKPDIINTFVDKFLNKDSNNNKGSTQIADQYYL